MDRAVPYGSTHSIVLERPLPALGARMTLWAAVCIRALTCPSAVHAQSVYRDPAGNFTVQVPQGWQTQPQDDNHSVSVVNERYQANDTVGVMRKPGGGTVCGERTLRVSGPARAAVPECAHPAARIRLHRRPQRGLPRRQLHRERLRRSHEIRHRQWTGHVKVKATAKSMSPVCRDSAGKCIWYAMAPDDYKLRSEGRTTVSQDSEVSDLVVGKFGNAALKPVFDVPVFDVGDRGIPRFRKPRNVGHPHLGDGRIETRHADVVHPPSSINPSRFALTLIAPVVITAQ